MVTINKVFLDNLPKRGRSIDWIGSKGNKVNFVYGDLKGVIEIIEYNLQERILKVKYNNIYTDIHVGNFKNGNIGKVLGLITNEFKYDLGFNIKDDNRNLTIIDRKHTLKEGKPDKKGRVYSKNNKMYKYKCNKCGFDCGEHYKNGEFKEELWINENSLMNGSGCSCCCSPSKILVSNINTIWDTNRWMCDLGISEGDAKKYTYGSNQRITVKCPDCGKTKTSIINNIYKKKSIGCTCGDGISYPEKFIVSVLNQLEVGYIHEANKNTFNWCNNYKYDFYLPDYNMIIETHGKQHYEESPRGRSLAKEQENDRIKKELALKNGISKYIIINCMESNVEYIKNSILNSKLNELFDLSNVDWIKCEEFALSNLVKEVCDYWNNKLNNETVSDLSKYFNLNRVTIAKYLKKGNELKWCEYDSNKSYYDGVRKKHKGSKKVEVFKNGTSLGIFISRNYISENSEILLGVKLSSETISRSCLGKSNNRYGFSFKYLK